MYALISQTSGDELAPPEKTIIAVSEYRGVLEGIKTSREVERKEWLDDNPHLAALAGGSIIYNETIEEVLEIK